MSSGSTDARVSENVRFLGVGTGVDVDLVSLLVRISACVRRRTRRINDEH